MSSPFSTGIFGSDRAVSGGTPYIEALASDIERYETLDDPTAVDDLIIMNCIIDSYYNERMKQFAALKRPRIIGRSEGLQYVIDADNDVEQRTKENQHVVNMCGVDDVLERVATESKDRIPSSLYPGYSPTLFEVIGRSAFQNTFLPVYASLFRSRSKRLLDAQPDEVDLFLLERNFLSSVFTLNHMLQKQEEQGASQQQINTNAGLVNEIDILAVGFMSNALAIINYGAEEVENDDGEPIIPTAWAFPSAIIDDLSGLRIDARVIGAHAHTGEPKEMALDIKLSKGGKMPRIVKPQHAGDIPKLRVNCIMTESFDDDGKPFPGKVASQVIDERRAVQCMNGDFDPAYSDETLVSRGLALGGISLMRN